MQNLVKTAAQLTAKGKGLLASDESTGTIGKRLEKAGISNTEVCTAAALVTRAAHAKAESLWNLKQEHRRNYRENFYTAPIGSSVSGVILFKEALQQFAHDGKSFVEWLNQQSVLPGVKVDEVMSSCCDES